MSGLTVVIVLNWNAEHDTAACFDSLALDPSLPHEVCLVDNDSADGSGARLHARYPGVAYLQTGGNLGYAGGNNAGIAWALARGAERIVVLNNDTVVEPGMLGALARALDGSPRTGAVAPTMVHFDAPDVLWYAGGDFVVHKALGVHRLAPPPPATHHVACTFLSGCCIMFRGEVLRTLGGFREDFFAYIEDAEMSVRVQRAGWAMAWVPAARLRHRVPALGTPDSPSRIHLRDRNRRRLVRSTYSGMERVRFALWFWPTRLAHAVRYLLAGDLPRLRALAAGCTER